MTAPAPEIPASIFPRHCTREEGAYLQLGMWLEKLL